GRPSHDDQHRRLSADAGGAAARHAARGRFHEARRRDHPAALPPGHGGAAMIKPGSIAIVGAAETTELGKIPHLSEIGLHADAALNAMKDAGLGPKDIDGIACVGLSRPQMISHYLGLTPKWVDGTGIGGCSFMLH